MVTRLAWPYRDARISSISVQCGCKSPVCRPLYPTKEVYPVVLDIDPSNVAFGDLFIFIINVRASW